MDESKRFSDGNVLFRSNMSSYIILIYNSNHTIVSIYGSNIRCVTKSTVISNHYSADFRGVVNHISRFLCSCKPFTCVTSLPCCSDIDTVISVSEICCCFRTVSSCKSTWNEVIIRSIIRVSLCKYFSFSLYRNRCWSRLWFRTWLLYYFLHGLSLRSRLVYYQLSRRCLRFW